MKKKKTYSFLLKQTWKANRGFCFLLMVVVIGAVFFALLPPLILEKMVDSFAAGKPILFSFAIFYFMAIVFSGLFDAAKEGMITIFGQRMTHQIRLAMSEKLKRLPTSYFIETDPGSLSSRFVNDVDTVEGLFSSGVISMLADVCKLVSILVVIYWKSPGLAILLTVATPILFKMTRLFQKKMLLAQMENRIAVGKTNQQIPEVLRNIRTIQSLHQETYMISRYGISIDQSYAAQERSNFYDAVYSPIIVSTSALLIGIMMALAAQSGFFQIFFGMSAGTAAAVIAYVGSFFEPLESIGMEIQNIQAAVSGLQRIREFLQEEEWEEAGVSISSTSGDDMSGEEGRRFFCEKGRKEASQSESGSVLEEESWKEVRQNKEECVSQEKNKKQNMAIFLSDVSFRYQIGKPKILQHFSLQVHEGENIILAGRTGVGKSTVIKLIAGLYQPQNGTVQIYGRNPIFISEEERRRYFGYVEQRFHFIAGTVGDQVSLRDPQITKTQIERALQIVGLWDVISQFPAGMDTICTEGLLSQGQFQLLSIARAIVCEPKILLLDEITAYLDSQTEQMVLTALKRASHGRTVISVSHRIYENMQGEDARMITLEE